MIKPFRVLSILLSIIFFGGVPRVFSQDFIDLLNTGVNYNPVNKYEETDSAFTFRHAFLNIQYPKVFENKDIFLTKLSLNQYTLEDTRTLYMYICYLQLGMLKHLGEKTNLRAAVTPKICSQFKDINGNDFVIPVIAVLQKKSSEKLEWGLGLLYSYEYFGHFLNPAIYVKWKKTDNWTLYSDFPSNGYIMYNPEKSFKTGIYVSSSTTTIRLSNEYNSAYIQKSYADLSLFYDLYFTKSVVMRIKGGYSTMRSLDMYAENEFVPFTFSLFEFGDKRYQLNGDINDAPFFEISLNYRYSY